MIDSFLTVSEFNQSEIKVKGSRFISSISPVWNEISAMEFIVRISSEFRDSTHNCYAYRIGIGNDARIRYSDAGEPSGTAGSAILSVIKNSGITNVALIVTRYFGGTKLGTGPLRRAYRDSALSVIRSSRLETRYYTQRYSFAIPYGVLKDTRRILKNLSAEIFHEEYLNEARFVVDVRKSLAREFEEKFREMTKGKVRLSPIGGQKDLHFS
ncbi:MAG: YigZ family protein [Acidobacteriota bacterium]